MSTLSRTRPRPPVRALHVGLGSFFRAHQAWYTHHADDGAEWGIAAFTGRSAHAATVLGQQDGLYVLDTRGAHGDRFEVVESLAAVHAADDAAAWARSWASADVSYVTLTVTEAGYRRTPAGGLDHADPDVVADLDALRSGASVDTLRTTPARIVAGLLARRRADAGPITLVPCDNLAGNGTALTAVLRETAEMVDPTLADWIETSVTVVPTEVDRITPATTDEDRVRIRAATGIDDASPVVTEPFSEWVLAGMPPGNRPAWETSGADFVDDVAPYESRKLALLNGSHSLLAYGGPLRGHRTVAEAIADPVCLAWVAEWCDEATRQLTLAPDALADYRASLLERFTNPAIRHLLSQIGQDGSRKLPERILPTLRAERAAGRVPTGACRVLAAWVLSVRDHDRPLVDPRADDLVAAARGPLATAVPRTLEILDPALADDDDVVGRVVALATGRGEA